MGGLIIIFATLVPVLLFIITQHLYCLADCNYTCGWDNWFIDYIKIFKKDKSRSKRNIQSGRTSWLGIIVGTVLYFSPSVTVRTDTSTSDILK
jgi:phospho-N-acetylmuramoyl-pentapeptide-transferase